MVVAGNILLGLSMKFQGDFKPLNLSKGILGSDQQHPTFAGAEINESVFRMILNRQ